MTSLLNIQHLSAGYKQGQPILEDFSLQLGEGERVGITGQNGSGKSTLAKAILGMAPYTGGSILWQGRELLKHPTHEIQRQGIGLFMQGGRVFGSLTVEENLKFILKERKNLIFNREITLSKINAMGFFADQRRMQLPASHLSGGERHLLGLVMTLMANPHMKLLIADEPSAGLAKGMQQQLLDIMDNALRQGNTSLLLIEQNHDFLATLTHKTLNLTKT